MWSRTGRIRWTLTEDLAWHERYVVDLEDRAPSRAWDVWNWVQQIISKSLFGPIQRRLHRDICRWSSSDRFVYVTFATGKRNWITGHEKVLNIEIGQTTTRDLQIPSAHTFSSTSTRTNDNSRAFKDRSETDAHEEFINTNDVTQSCRCAVRVKDKTQDFDSTIDLLSRVLSTSRRRTISAQTCGKGIKCNYQSPSVNVIVRTDDDWTRRRQRSCYTSDGQ